MVELQETTPAPSSAATVPARRRPHALAAVLAWMPWLVPLAVAVVATFTSSNYYLHLMIMWGIYAILTLSLNVVIGFAGLLSLGQAAFFGFGAYASAIAVDRYELPFPVALVLAVLVPAIIGFFLALPFMRLRLRGIYLGMATFGFGEIAFLIFRNWEGMTGGSLGMSAIPPPVLFGFEFIQQRPYVYLVVAMLLIVISVVLRLVNTAPGQVLLAIREDELAAEAAGIPTMRYQVAAFALGAGIAGLAGSLFAHYVTYLSPENFTSSISILALTMLIVGGRGNVLGSLVGAALLVALPEALRLVPEIRILAYGALLMLMATMRPQGILGNLRWGQKLPRYTPAETQGPLQGDAIRA
jgi:branched-chain amino acid transport system permease protein